MNDDNNSGIITSTEESKDAKESSKKPYENRGNIEVDSAKNMSNDIGNNRENGSRIKEITSNTEHDK